MFAFPNPDYPSLPAFRELAAGIDPLTRRAAMDIFLPAFHDRYVVHQKVPKPALAARIERGDGQLRRLQEEGFSLSRIPPALKAKLVALTAPAIAGLHERIAAADTHKVKEIQTALSPETDAGVFALLDEIFAESLLYDVAGAYVGRRLALAPRAAVQINTLEHTQRFYGEIEADGLPKDKARYLHIDSSGWPWIKVLIYLNPVGTEDGPFRYVAGSHTLAGDFELAVRKTVDKLRLTPRHFIALPEPFRMNTHFGDHLRPDAPGLAPLLRDEKAVCDGESDLIVFDNNGVHRGSFLRRGQRYMMQCFLAIA